jgi:hypothetical protein
MKSVMPILLCISLLAFGCEKKKPPVDTGDDYGCTVTHKRTRKNKCETCKTEYYKINAVTYSGALSEARGNYKIAYPDANVEGQGNCWECSKTKRDTKEREVCDY